MTPSRRRLARALSCTLALCFIAPSLAQAPRPAAAAPAAVDMKRLASEVWIYAFPLVLTDVTREVQSAGVPANSFRHRRTLPDAGAGEPDPNADFLYSQAWLDLSKGPVVLGVPDSKNRYYLLALLDAYSNVAGSIGPRTTGVEKREFALVGPGFKGHLPEGTVEIRSPTDLAWIFGRTAVADKGDVANAAKFQDQYKLSDTHAPAKGKRGKTPAAPAPAAGNVDTKTPPREQVAAMSAGQFFTRVAMLLPGNPPTKDDAPMLAKMKQLGIVPGKPFETTKLDAATAKQVEDGVKAALDAVVQASKGLAGADIRHGWRIDRALGRWGTDYGRRAIAAWKGLGVNAPEDAIFMSTYLDGGGRKLEGSNRYVLHFGANALPPTDGFWSLSMYDDKERFVANPLSRYSIGSMDKIRRNADGSIDIYLSNANPGGDKESNWLPAPKGPFNVILRVYWPKQDLIDGRWNPPGIKPAA
ncbi:MAG: DUF1254 domain-containing protein [Burkholderiales bacterium]|nr:DUF1254 domain-containing protein [Burkholderiales bacterium]